MMFLHVKRYVLLRQAGLCKTVGMASVVTGTLSGVMSVRLIGSGSSAGAWMACWEAGDH
jgi:hypothetical protein